VPLASTTLTVSLWFKTTTADGVLASLQKQAVSAGGTVTGYYDPVLYIGNDGRLWGQWYDSPQQPVESLNSVDDGLWHHAVLTATTSGSSVTQTLYIDGINQGGITSNFHFTSTWTTATNLTYGTGYIGGSWPDEPSNGGSGTLLYYTGTIANITLTHKP
jgi:large repetitive protein